jgi:acyl-CoA thioester hydrolase
MACEEDVTFKSLLWTILKYVDIQTGKKRTHHPEVMNYLKAIHYQGFNFETTSFEERIRQISADYKLKKHQS